MKPFASTIGPKTLLVITLAFFLLAAVPIRYVADDFMESNLVQQVGMPIHWFYQNWTGKFTYALEVGLFKPMDAPGIVTVLAIAIWAGALWMLFHRYEFLLIIPVAIVAAPDAIEAFYWQSGAIGYAMGIALFTLLLVAIWRDWRLCAVLLAFILAGTTDTMAVVQIVALIGLWVAFSEHRTTTAWAMIGAMIGLAVVLLAPGNAVRRAAFDTTNDIFLVTTFAVRTMAVPIAQAIKSAPLALAGAGMLAYLAGTREPAVRRISGQLLVVLLFVLAIWFTAAFASYYAAAMPLVKRASSIVVYFTLLAGLYSAWLCGRRWQFDLSRYRLTIYIGVSVACIVQGIYLNMVLWH